MNLILVILYILFIRKNTEIFYKKYQAFRLDLKHNFFQKVVINSISLMALNFPSSNSSKEVKYKNIIKNSLIFQK